MKRKDSINKKRKKIEAYPYAKFLFAFKTGTIVPVEIECPQCYESNEGYIDPSTGICKKCGFRIKKGD